ncbi:hypothetical protein [Devosia sp.]|uniref:hypothetical protein n=1 Tax=Devosia sp. TaxID=1871048 RepID=UPI0019F2BC24|nr:hypothetical protein [Devosia sp.]MBE0580016.1 hypothetical protein [Devosia sp.]
MVYVTVAEHTLEQLRTAIDEGPSVTGGMNGVLGRYIDERNGEIVVEFEADKMAAKSADRQASERMVAATLGVPVCFEAGEAAVLNTVYASGTLTNAGCTTGFTVITPQAIRTVC